MKRRTFITGMALSPLVVLAPAILKAQPIRPVIHPFGIFDIVQFFDTQEFQFFTYSSNSGYNLVAEVVKTDNTEDLFFVYQRNDFCAWVDQDLRAFMPEKKLVIS